MVFENQNDLNQQIILFNLKYVTSTTSRFSSTKVAYKMMSNQVVRVVTVANVATWTKRTLKAS